MAKSAKRRAQLLRDAFQAGHAFPVALQQVLHSTKHWEHWRHLHAEANRPLPQKHPPWNPSLTEPKSTKTKPAERKAQLNTLRAAFQAGQTFPVALQQGPVRATRWRYWRQLHREAKRPLPPETPPWKSLLSQSEAMAISAECKAQADTLRAAYQAGQAFPAALQQGVRAARHWQHWRQLHLEANRPLPPLNPPWDPSLGQPQPQESATKRLVMRSMAKVKANERMSRSVTGAMASAPLPTDHEAAVISSRSSSEDRDTDSDSSSDVSDSSDLWQPYLPNAVRNRDQEQAHKNKIKPEPFGEAPWTTAPTVTAETKDTLAAMSTWEEPDTNARTDIGRQSKELKEAFHNHLPFPEHLRTEFNCEGLWCFWRVLHGQVGRAEPPETPPWLSRSVLVEQLDAAQSVKLGPETSDVQMSDECDGEMALSESSDLRVQLCNAQQTRGPPSDGVPSKTKVMVANLPYDIQEDKLFELFKEYAPVSAKIVLRPIPRFMVKKLKARNEPRKGRGFAFVTLGNEELQKKAVEEVTGVMVVDREIVVKVAIDSPDKQEGEEVKKETHDSQPEDMLNSGPTAPLVPNQTAEMDTNHVLDHKPLLKEAFLQNLSFPMYLLQQPDCLEIWRYWRFLHHKAGKNLPPRAAPWLPLGSSASPVAEDKGHAPRRLDPLLVAEVAKVAKEGKGLPFDALSFMEDLVFEMEQALQRETA